MPEFGL
jgi:hypothetical protein